MARVRIDLKGIHRIRKRLANGALAEYHYAWRGGPRFWDSTKPFGKDSVEYVDAYQQIMRKRKPSEGTFQAVINAFLESQDFKDMAPRTQKDHRKNIVHANGIEKTFGTAPLSAFADPRIRGRAIDWRGTFAKGTGDNMMRTLQRIVSFGYDRRMISAFHFAKIRKRSRSSRAEIIWLPEEVAAFEKVAPRYVSNILVATMETGLRPGDLRRLTREHIHKISKDHWMVMMPTNKSNHKQMASIPVTPRFRKLLDELPAGQDTIILSSDGEPYRNPDMLGRAVSVWRDRLGLRKQLHLYDARGAAANRLLAAGCSIAEIAAHMGWSIQTAHFTLQSYATANPTMAVGILDKLMAHEEKLKTAAAEGEDDEDELIEDDETS